MYMILFLLSNCILFTLFSSGITYEWSNIACIKHSRYFTLDHTAIYSGCNVSHWVLQISCFLCIRPQFSISLNVWYLIMYHVCKFLCSYSVSVFVCLSYKGKHVYKEINVLQNLPSPNWLTNREPFYPLFGLSRFVSHSDCFQCVNINACLKRKKKKKKNVVKLNVILLILFNTNDYILYMTIDYIL